MIGPRRRGVVPDSGQDRSPLVAGGKGCQFQLRPSRQAFFARAVGADEQPSPDLGLLRPLADQPPPRDAGGVVAARSAGGPARWAGACPETSRRLGEVHCQVHFPQLIGELPGFNRQKRVFRPLLEQFAEEMRRVSQSPDLATPPRRPQRHRRVIRRGGLLPAACRCLPGDLVSVTSVDSSRALAWSSGAGRPTCRSAEMALWRWSSFKYRPASIG